MKLIGSWKYRYFGFKKCKMAYYVAWTYADARHWGYGQDYDGGRLNRFGLWFFDFHWHYDAL